MDKSSKLSQSLLPRICKRRPIYESPILDPTAWEEDAFQHLQDKLDIYSFLLPWFRGAHQGIDITVLYSELHSTKMASTTRFPELSTSVEEKRKIPSIWNILKQLHVRLYQNVMTLNLLKRLSSMSNERKAFLKKKWMLWHCQSATLKLRCSNRYGLFSMTGVAKGTISSLGLFSTNNRLLSSLSASVQ